MDQAKIDQILTYVREHGACTEEEIMATLDLSLFDVLEGLGHLERAGKLRSEELPTPPPLLPLFDL